MVKGFSLKEGFPSTVPVLASSLLLVLSGKPIASFLDSVSRLSECVNGWYTLARQNYIREYGPKCTTVDGQYIMYVRCVFDVCMMRV